ncbi:MAG: Ribose import binding protein RbsB [Verrucomicrobia subdivision 3 bacterium]|nr:Ribose import binding protein RbsB [Limisphaerales bacterium]MCS1415370.1 Ribose import binding protein RbsB [Limisphaerales bacterium]
MKKFGNVLISLSLGGLLFVGCSEGESVSEVESTSKGTVAISVLTTGNPFFNVIIDSLREEAAKHGYEVLATSGEFDVARQQNQVKDFIVKRVTAIVLCPCNSQSIGPAIVEANEAGIPVFTADIACQSPEAKVVTHVGTDNLGGGREAGKGMIEALGESGGKVVILDYKSVESCLMRVQGFKEVIEAHNKENPDQKISIVMELPGEGMKDRGYKAAEDAIQAHPDLAGIFAINDPSALGARAALEKAGKEDQVKIIGFDGQPEGKQAIKEGKIYADPIQFPDRIGKMTMQAIIAYLNGEKVESEILIPTELYRQSDSLADPELN